VPITTILSVLSTISEFIAHWLQANAALSAPVLLSGGYALAAMQAARTALEALFQEVADKESEESGARLSRYQLRNALYERTAQYGHALRVRAAGSSHLGDIPRRPHPDGGDDAFVGSVRDFIGHWRRVNAGLGADPLLLAGGYTLAQFEDDSESLAAALVSLSEKAAAASAARGERDRAIDEAVTRMLQYKDAAFVALFEHEELRATIPDVWADANVRPHRTILSGVWDAVQLGALLSWVANQDPDFHSYHVRCRAGTEAPTSGDMLIDTLTNRNQTSFLVKELFTAETPTWSFRVWVLDDAGRMSASNVVTVAMPA